MVTTLECHGVALFLRLQISMLIWRPKKRMVDRTENVVDHSQDNCHPWWPPTKTSVVLGNFTPLPIFKKSARQNFGDVADRPSGES